MPTFLRLIIMLGEIFGFIIVSIIRVNKREKKRRVCGIYSKKETNEAKKSDIKFAIVNNIIIVLIFFFSFYRLIFLSYHKMIYLSVFIVLAILYFLGDYLYENNIKKDCILTEKGKIGLAISLLSEMILYPSIILIFASSVSDSNINKFKVLTDQKERIEIIYPELMAEDKKIGHIRGTNRYVCFHKDSKGNWVIIDNMEIMPINLKNSNDTYIEKYTVTRTFNDIERDKNSDEYVIIENEVTYVLYLNKEQLIEIDKAE